MKYLSIITNFGCHYTCPYCIVKENGLKIPQTTTNGLKELINTIKSVNADIISLSGGGDPLFHYEDHKTWYKLLYDLIGDIPLEMHTSYTTLPESFDTRRYERIVYHCRNVDDMKNIKRRNNEIIRVVYVVDDTFTKEKIDSIYSFVQSSTDINELSFRQMVDNHYETTHYLEDYLKANHQKKWWYIEQNDYNIYYAENKTYKKYHDIH